MTSINHAVADEIRANPPYAGKVLPKYIYKSAHGSTYRVQIKNKYVGSFPSVEEAQQFIADLLNPTQLKVQNNGS